MASPIIGGGNPKGLPNGGMPSNKPKKPPLIVDPRPLMPKSRKDAGIVGLGGNSVDKLYNTY